MDEVVEIDVGSGDESFIQDGRDDAGKGVPTKEVLATPFGSDPEVVFWF